MDNILDIIKKEYRLRTVEESLERIVSCVNGMTIAQIWYRHNRNTNPIGNLVLHLEGNIRQYIISGVGGHVDVRKRSVEFSTNEQLSAELLAQKLCTTIKEANHVVQQLSFVDLSKKVSIQGFDHTVLSAIIHVIEHLSYHTGQITYYHKFINNLDTGYYAGLDLDVTD